MERRELILSLVVRKPAFCICENKDADQLRSNREADKRLCFRYIYSTIPLLAKIPNFKPLAIFCGCTARFVSDLVTSPEDRFSRITAHITFFMVVDELLNDKTKIWALSPAKTQISLGMRLV